MTDTPDTANELLETARLAAEAAAKVHRYFEDAGPPPGIEEKGRGDFVSEVDLSAQRAALAVISDRFPTHRILAEEDDGTGAEQPGTAGDPHLWIVDPLDGTANYLHNHPMYCSSVAVARDDILQAGCIVASVSGESWTATRGGGAFKSFPTDGGMVTTPIRVSTERNLGLTLVGTGFPFKRLDLLPEYLGQFDRVLRSASGIRRGGSAALDLCYLAQGSLDCFWEMFLSPWDVAAGLLILEEAGGVANRIDGSPIDFEGGSVIGANSTKILELLMAVVRKS